MDNRGMPRQFANESCIFCQRPSSRSGEHVWPQWFLAMFPVEDGPYTWWIDGVPLANRDGRRRAHSAIGRVKVPACASCNAILARRFEAPAMQLVRRLFETDADVVFSAGEARSVGRWLLKTWLLLAHPAARDSEPGIALPRWKSVREDLWTWMVTGRRPPEGLSVWAIRRGDEASGSGSTRHISLPTVVADGHEVEFVCKRAGVLFLDISLAYHPGWPIEHPLEGEGRALRLWPRRPSESADFGALPEVGPREIAWMQGPRLHFFPGTFPSLDLPPLSADFNPTMDLPHRFLQMAAW